MWKCSKIPQSRETDKWKFMDITWLPQCVRWLIPLESSSWEKEALLGSDSHGRTWEEAGLGRRKCRVVLEIQQSLLRSNKEVQGQDCVERSLMLTEMAGPLHSLSGWDRPQKTGTSGIPSQLTARRCQLTTFLRTGQTHPCQAQLLLFPSQSQLSKAGPRGIQVDLLGLQVPFCPLCAVAALLPPAGQGQLLMPRWWLFCLPAGPWEVQSARAIVLTCGLRGP